MRPTVHGVAAEAPTAGQKLPAVHGAHTVRPVVAANVPTAQGVPAERPVVAQKVPTKQSGDAVAWPPHAAAVPLALDGFVPGQNRLTKWRKVEEKRSTRGK